MVTLFGLLTVVSAFLVVVSRNPVHSVFFLIFAFLNASAVLYLLGLEFLAFLVVVVYAGAVAVLFLFVVMMLRVRVAGFFGHLDDQFLFGLLVFLLVTLQVSIPIFNLTDINFEGFYFDWSLVVFSTFPLDGFAFLLFNRFWFSTFLSAFLLLVGLIVSVHLTANPSVILGVRIQLVHEQVTRSIFLI